MVKKKNKETKEETTFLGYHIPGCGLLSSYTFSLFPGINYSVPYFKLKEPKS